MSFVEDGQSAVGRMTRSSFAPGATGYPAVRLGQLSSVSRAIFTRCETRTLEQRQTAVHEHVHDHVNVHVDMHVVVDVVGFFSPGRSELAQSKSLWQYATAAASCSRPNKFDESPNKLFQLLPDGLVHDLALCIENTLRA